ncbi:putative HTH-type transcriptional regulator YgaV [Burkholderiales bacterium]|nr:putative HTH-type transcriptional regulator YgaV [Burkholderiales bacterium]
MSAKSVKQTETMQLDAELAAFCKAMGHPARLALLRFLSRHETCFFGDFSEIVPLSASTISQHLAVLEKAGLIRSSAERQRGCYCVDPKGLQRLRELMGRAIGPT